MNEPARKKKCRKSVTCQTSHALLFKHRLKWQSQCVYVSASRLPGFFEHTKILDAFQERRKKIERGKSRRGRMNNKKALTYCYRRANVKPLKVYHCTFVGRTAVEVY